MDENRVAEWPSAGTRRRRAWPLLAALASTLAIVQAAPAAAAPNGAAAWGYNASGQLGNGSTAISRVAVAVSAIGGVSAVAAGGEHSLALLSNGTVMAWGSNREGQLGNGTTTSSKTPIAISALSGVVAVAAGKTSSMALLSDGTVMTWGSNEEGQLGNASKALKSTSPVLVKGLSGVTAISAGGQFDLARLSNGTVMAWGAGLEGQLGNGKKAKSGVPVAVKGLTGVTAVAAGREHALALLSDGTAMSWGSNISRQLGMAPKIKVVKEEGEEFLEEEEEPENSAVPIPVQALSGATAVAAGGEHSLALLGDGEVLAWGGNIVDQLGNGSSGGSSGKPTAVVGLGGVTSIAAGEHHSLALLSGGSIVAWGYNPDGQLGDNSNQDSPVPVAVTGLGGVTGIAGGGAHSLSFGAALATVASVAPSSGPQPGGTTVTITGANFSEATAVSFGATPAASFTVNSASSITAVSPAGTGVVDVTVTTPATTSTANAGDRFTYIPPPAITKITPTKGPAAGGTSVTITGTSFTGASSVSFGATPAASFTVNSASSITAVSPIATSGLVDIVVSTPSGESAKTYHDVFKFAAPTIASLTPNTGPRAGGTSVTVSGSGFAPGAGVTVFKFRKTPAISVECQSTTSCTLLTPPGKPGTFDVKATVAEMNSVKTPPADYFTYE
jgi:alpha-tubulin suppressor-like RCC1 family protein